MHFSIVIFMAKSKQDGRKLQETTTTCHLTPESEKKSALLQCNRLNALVEFATIYKKLNSEYGIVNWQAGKAKN